ncbi:MAG: hypothetical protein JW804_00170 [Sedimentisphaerales bacterium]|nr:hypothetical protein [Sedimentisphaerales bacterium]
MLRKLMLVFLMITISFGILSGCKKSKEDKAKDAVDDAAKDVKKALD